MKTQTQQKIKIDLILKTSISPKKKLRRESCSPSYSYCATIENQKQKQGQQYHYFQDGTTSNIKQFITMDNNRNNVFHLHKKMKTPLALPHQLKSTLESGKRYQPQQSFAKMMDTIVEKYKKKKMVKDVQMEKQAIQIKYQNVPLNGSINLKNTLDLYEDRVELYRLMKSNKIPTTTFNSQSFNKVSEDSSKKKRSITSCSQRKYWTIQGKKCITIKPNQKPRKKLFTNQDNIPKTRPSTTQGFQRKKSLPVSKAKNFLPIKTIDEGDYSYSKRLRSFLQFLLKINFSNKIYVSLDLMSSNYLQREQHGINSSIKKYKAYVGGGNNSFLIKSILGNRFWFEIVDNISDPQLKFCWTQNKRDDLHAKQSCIYGDNQKFILMGAGKEKQIQKYEKLSPETFEYNKKILSGEDIWNVEKFISLGGFEIPYEEYHTKLITNHLPHNSFISAKKKLHNGLFNYYNFHKKDPFDHIPRTYTVVGNKDIEFNNFWEYVKKNKLEDSIWIVKPGEHTNRGNGIKLAKANNVEKIISRNVKHSDGTPMSYIIQSYISKPLLYNNRKFDIRHYILITSVKGNVKAYWYKEGYIRTSSQIYDLEDTDNLYIHLTNDAIQKSHENYGVYEASNKISYNQFQRYMDYHHMKSGFLMSNLLEQMKTITKDVIRANYKAIDTKRNQCNFQLFGMDFMIDEQLKPWLIQINSNPCLQMNCPILNRIIPGLIQNTFRLGLDPLLPPKNHYPVNKRYTLTDKHLKNLKYQIIFDEFSWKDAIQIKNLNIGSGDEQQQQFPDDGKPLVLDIQNFNQLF